MVNNGTILLRCQKCNTPCAYLENGELVIKARHWGETHENRYKVEDLLKLMRADNGVYIKG